MPSWRTAGVRFRRFFGRAACLALLAASRLSADELPLHERIDQSIEQAGAGLVAPLASDGDFLRRAYLDLNGTIPSAAAARAFLDDPASNKRESLIDALLAVPQFARHMQRVWDVMLMERRAEKAIPVAEWQEYLRQSFAANKPLDQLVREILSADGVDPALRPAARFYLDRDADANLITRDVGRLFFGRDMQCAQCHDHPNIADYLQSDYYGLMAFVNRGALFLDAKAKKSFYEEKADGEVNYKSVFTGDARDHVVPKLPGGLPVDEPTLGPDDKYVIAPGKEVRGVPKYSRRAQLAAQTAAGSSPAFARNLANRLWAQMMGRGLVHPLDFDHSANPPVESQLLALLADELAKMKFDAKRFLRELALSRTYQRSSQPPAAESVKLDPAALASTIAGWSAEAQQAQAQLESLEKASNEAAGELNASYEAYSKSATARDAAEKTHAEAKKASNETAAALAAAIKDVAAKEEIEKLLIEARDKAQAAVAKLPGDKPLADAADQFRARAADVSTQLTAARQSVTEKTPQVQAASLRLAEVDKSLQPALAAVAVACSAVHASEDKARGAIERFRAAKARQRELTARVADAQAALACQTLVAARALSQAAAGAAREQLAALRQQGTVTAEQLAEAEARVKTADEKAANDAAAVEQSIAAIVDRATARFTLAGLKPLSPEQLAFATMEAVGQSEAQRKALEAQANKDAEAIAGLAPEARAGEVQRLLEARVDEKLRGHVAAFVPLFGQQPGQAPTFQATVHQALFLANGGLLAGWLNPGGDNLTERLSKIEEPARVADELYLTVLSRRPSAEETSDVGAFWEKTKTDRRSAARDLAWSLLTSTEFRFNH